jgi:hypothetical protein
MSWEFLLFVVCICVKNSLRFDFGRLLKKKRNLLYSGSIDSQLLFMIGTVD